MGLLDDAIRDHLELKRLGGADPDVVDREQREALDPVLRDEAAEHEGHLLAAQDDLTREPHEATTPVGAQPGDDPRMISDLPPTTESADVAQETAELDMQAVLEGQPPTRSAQASHEQLAIAADSPAADSRAEDRGEGPLEWEVPGEPSQESPADVAPQVPYTQRL
jgi:hypothetical protein